MNSVKSKVKFKTRKDSSQGFPGSEGSCQAPSGGGELVAENQETNWPGPDHGQTNVLTPVCFLLSYRLP